MKYFFACKQAGKTEMLVLRVTGFCAFLQHFSTMTLTNRVIKRIA